VGLENKAVSNVTFDRLVGRHVLKQGEAIEQTVRVDEGPLLAVFRQNPSMLMEFEIYMKTNPVRSGGGVMVPGPCGLRVDTLNAISRLGTPVLEDASRQAELEKLSSSAATEQLRIMEFLDESTQYFKPPPQLPGLHLAAPTTGPVDDALWTADARAAIMPLAASPLAAVRGAAMCALAGLPGADRATLIAGMLADPDPMVRLLGLDSAERESDHGLAADQAARDDSDDLVRALAQARLDLLVAPATQSTAQPAAGTGAVAVPTTAQRSATTNPS